MREDSLEVVAEKKSRSFRVKLSKLLSRDHNIHHLKGPKIWIKVYLSGLTPKQAQKQCKICLTICH